MGKFPTFKLTEWQIRGIANIVLHEQGTIAGWFAEASQIANLCEIKYGGDPVRAVKSGWYAYGKSRYNAGTTNQTVINIVKRVFLDGYRTLPKYVEEHDAMSDVKSVTENGKSVKHDKSKWKRHSTVIRNRMGSTYYFYDFPGGYKTGVDPFGYTDKKLREKYGDFYYTVEQAMGKEEPKTDMKDKVIKVAEAEEGYLEKKSNSGLDSKTSNAKGISYYPKCKSTYMSLTDALKSIGADSSMTNRKKIAAKNGIKDYKGTSAQNIRLLAFLKTGKLIKP